MRKGPNCTVRGPGPERPFASGFVFLCERVSYRTARRSLADVPCGAPLDEFGYFVRFDASKPKRGGVSNRIRRLYRQLTITVNYSDKSLNSCSSSCTSHVACLLVSYTIEWLSAGLYILYSQNFIRCPMSSRMMRMTISANSQLATRCVGTSVDRVSVGWLPACK